MKKEAPVILGWVIMILLSLTISLYSKEYHELKAQCTSQEFYRVDCKVRTSDDSIYVNHQWTNIYIIEGVALVDDKLNIYLIRKEYYR